MLPAAFPYFKKPWFQVFFFLCFYLSKQHDSRNTELMGWQRWQKKTRSFSRYYRFYKLFHTLGLQQHHRNVFFNVTVTEEKAEGSKVFAVSAVVFVKYLHACIVSLSSFTYWC